MELSYAIPNDQTDKSEHFNHYAEMFTLFKAATHLFKPVTTILVTIGICLSLGIIQFSPKGAILPLGVYYTGLFVAPIAYFIWFLIGMNEKLTGSFTRYVFHVVKKYGGKNWLNFADIILHVIIAGIITGLTFAFFSIAHNSGTAIGESLKQTNDDGTGIVEQKDSAYIAKKEQVNAKFDTLLTKRQATVNEQIVAENKALLLIPRKQKSERQAKQDEISALISRKTEIEKSVDSLKALDLAELATLYAGTVGKIKTGNDAKAKVFSSLAANAQKTIVGFLGFDVFIVVLGAMGLQIIKQQNGIQPVYEVKQGDFGDRSRLNEILFKLPRVGMVRLLNMVRRIHVPKQDAPKKEGYFFNPNNFKGEVEVKPRGKGNGSSISGQMVFTNP